MIVSHSVDLPIPLRPMIATDSTPIENDTFSKHLRRPVAGAQVADVEQRCQAWVPAIPR